MTNVANTQAIWAERIATDSRGRISLSIARKSTNNAWRALSRIVIGIGVVSLVVLLHHTLCACPFDGKQGGKSKWRAKRAIKFRRFYDTHNICGYVDDIFARPFSCSSSSSRVMCVAVSRSSINFIAWLEPNDQNIRKYQTKNIKTLHGKMTNENKTNGN